MADVVLDGVTKVCPNGFKAVTELDLEIKDGEFPVPGGPSGCGKSAALRMIAELGEISSGELRVGDRVLTGLSPKGRDSATVSQNDRLYPHTSVHDNISFVLELAKTAKNEIDHWVREAAAILWLEDQLDRKPGQLSSGQRQQVAMGKAIVPPAVGLPDGRSTLQTRYQVASRDEGRDCPVFGAIQVSPSSTSPTTRSRP